ncbi:NAD(P)H-binding protein [Aquimarina sp. U1-2]|uniref:NAD(P)H-binding protein n=1 Tax=Aquimarina sp. U1-2 TaxID=2823141 RepID=UPI001AECDF7F|nr:NAD(P)H-binding protein [Aquimarina sp. U1-2]MBP2833780.1 NAD(P)H-binding protein [Aquimarina sp. U1-2]
MTQTHGGDAYKDYLQAKADGENELTSSSLDWTIIRPGSLHNNPPKNQVTLNQNAGGMGSISREDVAAVAVACLENENAIGKTFELYDGNSPIKEAVSQL